MKLQSLQQRVLNAVRRFEEHDTELLKLKVYEPAVSHRIAVYLEQEFKDSDLNYDCEYDKRFDSPKKMPSGRAIRPDILVHKRNCQENNILAIEIKKNRRNKWDEQKLTMLTKQGGDYRYALGVFIYFPKGTPHLKWFTNGQGSNFKQL